MVNCPNCGDPLDPGQKFCEKCGAKVGSAAASGGSSAPSSSGGLFDQSRDYYVLKEKYWDWGSGPILDEKGQEIGKMHRKLLSIRKRIEFMELDGTISAYIQAKLLAIKPSHDLKDGDGNQLARLEKTFFSFIRPKFYLKDPMGNKIMMAQGKFMGFSFTVTDMNGKPIATIEKADKWRDMFLGGLMDFKDTYALKIEDPNVDRRLLLGFVVAIDNVIHDTK